MISKNSSILNKNLAFILDFCHIFVGSESQTISAERNLSHDKRTKANLVDTPANLLSPVMHKIVVVESTIEVSVPGERFPFRFISFLSILYEATSFPGSKWRIFDLLWNDRSTGPSCFAAFARIAFIFDARILKWLDEIFLLNSLMTAYPPIGNERNNITKYF